MSFPFGAALSAARTVGADDGDTIFLTVAVVVVPDGGGAVRSNDIRISEPRLASNTALLLFTPSGGACDPDWCALNMAAKFLAANAVEACCAAALAVEKVVPTGEPDSRVDPFCFAEVFCKIRLTSREDMLLLLELREVEISVIGDTTVDSPAVYLRTGVFPLARTGGLRTRGAGYAVSPLALPRGWYSGIRFIVAGDTLRGTVDGLIPKSSAAAATPYTPCPSHRGVG